MGCGNINDKDNPPVPLKQSNEFVLTSKESEANDNGQISHVNNTSVSAFTPCTFVSVPSSGWENAHGVHQSYTQDPGNMLGFMRPGTSQNAHTDHSFIDLRGGLRNRDTCPSGLNPPQVNVNFVPNPTTAPGGHYLNAHVGEGKVSDLNQLQITDSSLYSRYNPSMAQSTRETFVNNDAKVGAPTPGKIDGSFLTLGIGGNAESGTKHKFSSREIASSLEKSGDFQVWQTTPTFSSISQSVTGSSSGLQSNPRVFSGSMSSSLGALTSSCNNDQIPNYGVVGLSSNAFQGSHMQEAFKQYDFFQSRDSNLGIASKSLAAYPAQVLYNHYQGDSAPALVPFNNIEPYISHPGFTKFSDPASESANFMQTTFQPTIGQLKNCHARNDRDATSYYASNSISLTTSPVTQDYIGKLIPPVQGSMNQAVGGGPSSIGLQPNGHISSTLGVSSATPLESTTFPEKIVPQIAEATAIKPATVFPFPRRLGVQPYDDPQSVSQAMPPRVMGVQTKSGVHQSQPAQLTNSFLGCTSGTGPISLNPKADKPSQVSNVIGQPSLKRRAAEPPPVASWGRRKRLMHQSASHNSAIYQRQGTAATLPPSIPSATPHIRWQGFDKLRQHIGIKCSICKRDLSFTPDGPVFQPSVAPPIAVLPCGHTFHDQCLQRITPEDQITEPPCIPCAIGET